MAPAVSVLTLLLAQVCAPAKVEALRAVKPVLSTVNPPVPPLKLPIVVFPLPLRVRRLAPLLTRPVIRGLALLLVHDWAAVVAILALRVTAAAGALTVRPLARLRTEASVLSNVAGLVLLKVRLPTDMFEPRLIAA